MKGQVNVVCDRIKVVIVLLKKTEGSCHEGWYQRRKVLVLWKGRTNRNDGLSNQQHIAMQSYDMTSSCLNSRP